MTSNKYYFLQIVPLLFSFFGFTIHSVAQHNNEFYNNGALVSVQAGAEIHILGDMHMLQASGSLQNNGLIKVQGNCYSDNLFQQRGTGTVRIQNSNVNLTERQFISGSYVVRGGQAQIGVNDGSFYNLELANSQGIVYLVGSGNIADVRNNVNFNFSGTPNRIITHNIGLSGAITNPANGANYTGVFGIMRPNGGLGAMTNNTVTLNGNMSGVDTEYIQGKLRRAILPGGGNYGFVLGLEPAGATAQRGLQYSRLEFGANNYDVITGYFQSGSSNAGTAGLECSGNLMNYFGGVDHGEWMFTDITSSGSGSYGLTIWPQNHNYIATSIWMITKDNSFQGTANQCGPTTTALNRAGFNGFNNPSEFNVAAPISPLPSELLKIWLVPEDSYLSIKWDVASEYNVDYYEVQRSEDGQDFVYLGLVQASGNSTTALHYKYDDTEIERNHDYYYRYKAVDFNGDYYLSPIVTGRLSLGGTDFSDGKIVLFPNPSSSNVTIAFTMNQPKNIGISVYNVFGQIVHDVSLNIESGNTSVPIESSNWSSGVYMIRIENHDSEETVWKKFIKD